MFLVHFLVRPPSIVAIAWTSLSSFLMELNVALAIVGTDWSFIAGATNSTVHRRNLHKYELPRTSAVGLVIFCFVKVDTTFFHFFISFSFYRAMKVESRYCLATGIRLGGMHGKPRQWFRKFLHSSAMAVTTPTNAEDENIEMSAASNASTHEIIDNLWCRLQLSPRSASLGQWDRWYWDSPAQYK